MKITKRQLRRIIREALGDQGGWYSDKHETMADKKFADQLRDEAYEDGFAGYHEGRDEPGHHFRDFEDDWMAGWYDAKSSSAGDYNPSPQGYDPDPSWEDSLHGEPRR